MSKAYILFKDGSVNYTEITKKVKIKASKVKAIFLECWHPVFGFFYVAQNPKTFKKTMDYAKRSIVSYRFLDGILVDDEDDFLFVKNKYWYYNPQDLFSKIMEICINEYIFNDAFWIYDSFFQYIYDNVKVKLKGKKRKKTMSGYNFRSKFIGYKSIFKKDIIQISKDKWSEKSMKKAKNECFVQLYTNIYFKIDSKLFTLGKYDIYSDIYLVQDDFVLNEHHAWGKLNKIEFLQNILETYVSKYIIRKLERGENEEGKLVDTYKVKTHVKFKNKKINKKKYKFGKFVRKFFVDIKKY